MKSTNPASNLVQMLRALSLAILMVAASAGSAWAAPGDLDPAFGGDGKVTTAFFTDANASATVYAIAVQPDGKIVAAGSASRSQQTSPGSGSEFALARYNADGSLDTSFSGDGKVTKDIAGGQDYAYGVAVQADGKIIAVGSANSMPRASTRASRWCATTPMAASMPALAPPASSARISSEPRM